MKKNRSQSILDFILAFIGVVILSIGIARTWIWFNAKYANKQNAFQRTRLVATNPDTMEPNIKKFIPIGEPDLPLDEDWVFKGEPSGKIALYDPDGDGPGPGNWQEGTCEAQIQPLLDAYESQRTAINSQRKEYNRLEKEYYEEADKCWIPALKGAICYNGYTYIQVEELAARAYHEGGWRRNLHREVLHLGQMKALTRQLCDTKRFKTFEERKKFIDEVITPYNACQGQCTKWSRQIQQNSIKYCIEKEYPKAYRQYGSCHFYNPGPDGTQRCFKKMREKMYDCLYIMVKDDAYPKCMRCRCDPMLTHKCCKTCNYGCSNCKAPCSEDPEC